MSYTPKVPGRGKLHRAVLATAGAACLLLGSVGPVAAVDWPQPLPENEFGTSNRIDVYEGAPSPAGVTNDGVKIFANPNPTEPSTGTGVFQPFYTVHRSTGACGGSKRCIDYVAGGQAVDDVKVEGGFNTDTDGTSTNFEMARPSAGWTRSVTMSEFNIMPWQEGYIELAFDANETAGAGSDPNKIVITELQIFVGADLATPESSGEGEHGYTGGTFDTEAMSASPNQLWNSSGTMAHDPRWSLDSDPLNGGNGNVDILLNASICANNGQCGSGHGDMSIFIPIAHLGDFNQDDNFVLYTENMFVDDGYTEVRFRTAAVVGVPEPGMLALFGLGVMGVGYVRRRRASDARDRLAA